jgi:hypothetical protein
MRRRVRGRPGICGEAADRAPPGPARTSEYVIAFGPPSLISAGLVKKPLSNNM